MAHLSSRAPATSSSLRLEVLPDDLAAPSSSTSPPASSSSSSPSSSLSPHSQSIPRSGSSTLTAPSKLRHVTSHSTFSSTSSGGRSRSGSITSPRPANLSLLAPPSPSSTPAPTSTSSSSTSPSSSSTLAAPVQGRPRSGSAAPVLSSNSFRKKSVQHDEQEADHMRTQLNLSLDKGPPQSIDTWDPVIPDIMVHDEDAHHSSDQADSTEDLHQHHDEEEDKIVSAYQILNLIIPDISEAAAAADAAEQQELEQQQQQQQENEQGQPIATSQSSTATALSEQAAHSSSNTNEKTMSEFLKANATSATDYLALSSMGIGAGLIPPSASGPSSRSGTPLPPMSASSSALNLANPNSPAGGINATPPATLSSRFRLPFSSKAFVPPSRPASVHQLNQPPGEASFAGQENNPMGINNPMQSSANLGNGSGIRSSFFDYRLTNLLQFAGSSIAPSIRSFDPNRTMGDGSNDENRQEFYEVEFNVAPDPAKEEAMRYDHTAWGRIRKVLRSGFPGRDLDPQTRKPRYKYPTNNIKTTKYTLLTFLPVNLLFQFKRFYNIYFLCAAIFVCAEPSLSPVTEILPLTLVLTITAVKDALEDY
ncbi:ATPase class I type 8B member 4, partial [Linnemannia schmuckeri]